MNKELLILILSCILFWIGIFSHETIGYIFSVIILISTIEYINLLEG